MTRAMIPNLTIRLWQRPDRQILPLDWLSAAAGKSLHVGIALWIMGNLQRSQVVAFSNSAIRRFGLDRNAKYRGLAWLEEAGLVSVRRKLGRAPTVTILSREP